MKDAIDGGRPQRRRLRSRCGAGFDQDREAQGAVTELIERAEKAASTAYVINQADGRSGLAKFAADVIRARSAVEPRADYVRADAAGKAGSEINLKARAEIAALLSAAERIGDGAAD